MKVSSKKKVMGNIHGDPETKHILGWFHSGFLHFKYKQVEETLLLLYEQYNSWLF